MTLHPSEVRAGDTCGHLEASAQHQQLASIRDSWGNPSILADSERKQSMQMWKAKNASYICTASTTAARDGRSQIKRRGHSHRFFRWLNPHKTTLPSAFPMANRSETATESVCVASWPNQIRKFCQIRHGSLRELTRGRHRP
jgi:hypothetical protein